MLDGQTVVPGNPVRQMAGATPDSRNAALLIQQLTPREREVLTLLAQGIRGPNIAAMLSLSPNTLRTHVQNILMKLQVHSRLEAATFATRHGLVKPERH